LYGYAGGNPVNAIDPMGLHESSEKHSHGLTGETQTVFAVYGKDENGNTVWIGPTEKDWEAHRRWLEQQKKENEKFQADHPNLPKDQLVCFTKCALPVAVGEGETQLAEKSASYIGKTFGWSQGVMKGISVAGKVSTAASIVQGVNCAVQCYNPPTCNDN
jgi:hypothetical protein